MRIWVTGAGGFVGTRLVARLSAAGHEVHASDRELDVADAARVARGLARARPQAIVHLAALSSVSETAADPWAALRVNYFGARSVLAGAVREVPHARVLLVGSAQVYGSAAPGSPAFDERAPLRPASAYAWTKASADLLGAVHARRGLDVVRVRPFNHTGPGRPDRFVEASFARQIAEIEAGLRPPRIEVGNLDAVRDFLHVDDVIDAYVRLLDRSAPPGVYNVASGAGLAVGAILAALLALSPLGARVEVRMDRARWRPTETSVGRADRLAEKTGWAPRVPTSALWSELLDDWRRRVATQG